MSNITGIEELTKQFKKLEVEMREKTAKRMVASAAAVLRKEAKSIALQRGLKKSGALIRNIALKRERNVPRGTVQYNIGVKHGRDLGNGKKVIKFLAINKNGRIVTKRENDPFYFRFLEFGTKFIQKHAFIATSLKNKKQEAVDMMIKKLNDDINKIGR